MFGYFNGSYIRQENSSELEKELFVVIEFEDDKFYAYEIRSTKFLADASNVDELVEKIEREYDDHIIYYA
jgi:hypothetical protein